MNHKKISKQISKNVLFLGRKSDCEVCGKYLPKQIILNEETFTLFNYEKPKKPYLILELISKEIKYNKGLYIIQKDDDTNEIKIVKN